VGKTFNLTFAVARERYEKKGASCSGADAPESAVGAPDQRNEMQVGRDKVVLYGFRFPEGTLVVRCKDGQVETSRVLR
jgi:hypothetical protein